MVARVRRALAERDQGFTLIELLAVIVIIGILAAIAIPVFLSQRKKGVDAALKSDLTNASIALEVYMTDTPTATTAQLQGVLASPSSFRLTPGNTVAVAAGSSGTTGYCITASNPAASKTTKMMYDSVAGGLLGFPAAAPTSGACATIAP